MDINQIFKILNTNEKGLSDDEVLKRREKYGTNEIKSERKINPFKIFLDQFKDFLVIILILATIISFIIGEVLDAIIILVIVLMCAILGFLQEYRSEKAMENLKKMSAQEAKVIRNGKEMKIPATELVPGDIIIFETGDKIPADGRIIEEINSQIDESLLTGESVPVKKNVFTMENIGAAIADRKNMVYAGTIVTYGHGKAVVTAIGHDTELGKIAKMIEDIEITKTPLQVKLDGIGKFLGISCLIICFIAFIIGVLKGYNYLDMLIWSVSLGVAAIPEALPAVVTSSLAIGAQRMAKRNAVIRKLPAVETLGCTTVICSDKTGTITKNEMTVKRIYANNKIIHVSGDGYNPQGKFMDEKNKIFDPMKDPQFKIILEISALCNDANLVKENGQWKIIGDPTEGSILVLSRKAGIDFEKFREDTPRAAEIPFDMDRKRMTTIHKFNGKYFAYTKGAPEIIIGLSTKIMENGKLVELTDEKRKELLKIIDHMASHALRVLAFSYREVDERMLLPTLEEINPDKIEKDMVFVGFVGMIDPPRKESKKAIRECKTAGIRTIIVTGDHALTTLAIAKEIGLVKKTETIKSNKIMVGEELERISDEELKERIDEIVIFARVAPHHKLRIVNLLKEKGHVVAMTGDGVNDAPALKSADIGIAMGITGTDVAKEASDMILLDDNFSTIVNAVKEGRRIYENIKKYLTYLIRCNIGEILVLTSSFFIGLPTPLIAIQILMVNLITDGLPALALGMDPPDEDIMRRKPRKPTESIFSRKTVILMSLLSFNMLIALLPIFKIYLEKEGLIKAQTMVFVGLSMFQFVNSYISKSGENYIFKTNLFGNKWLNLSIIFSILFLILIIQVPVFGKIFGVERLGLIDWILITICSMSALLFSEVGKFVLNFFDRK
ncbi:MAG: cation-translocating P-type ATPase [Candidatus Aenigmatarchaeota archaeon]